MKASVALSLEVSATEHHLAKHVEYAMQAKEALHVHGLPQLARFYAERARYWLNAYREYRDRTKQPRGVAGNA